MPHSVAGGARESGGASNGLGVGRTFGWKVLFAFVACLVAVPAAQLAGAPAARADDASYTAAVSADGAIAYWRLGETSGTTAADASANLGRDGTYTGGVTLNVNGALMMPGTPAVAGTQIAPSLLGTMNLKYVQANVDLPDLSDKNQIPQSVKVLSWSNQ